MDDNPVPIRTTTEVDEENYIETTTNFYEDGSYHVKKHYTDGPDDENNWSEEWYDNLNQLHRDSELGPAFTNSSYGGNTNVFITEVYYTHGEVKRTNDGPTKIMTNTWATGYTIKEIWMKGGVKHNIDGPAVVITLNCNSKSDMERENKSIWYNEGIQGLTVYHYEDLITKGAK
ncbi:hypothetical protein COU54_01430 [Candidatus Pacearchaeota archaeon CG10_big_fil_rev_8_21_14_0_10_31_24]|nr:MAG: hypothetical protein COU54_01430 [Candidatus Pacearchaeota archaeon CG10_big_fil_rev_8_21_14_0_10_31_24]